MVEGRERMVKEDDYSCNLHLMITIIFSPEQVQRALIIKRQSQLSIFFFKG